MRAVFAIAPLAIMLAWWNPHTGARSIGLAGAPTTAWAMGDAPTSSSASAADLHLVAYGSETEATRDGHTPSATPRPRTAPGSLLVNSAVVR